MFVSRTRPLVRPLVTRLYTQSIKITKMSSSASGINTLDYYNDTKAPIVRLSAKVHFDKLSLEEQKYAHFFSKASHAGSRAVLRSVSPESEAIYDLILSLHKKVKGDYSQLESATSKAVVQDYLEYASMFLSNLGNYKSFGDVKFVPRLLAADFDALIKAVSDSEISELYDSIREPLYSLNEKNALLGFNDKGHVTSYYLNIVTQEEAEAVNSALIREGILPVNTRVSKAGDNQFVVHVASGDETNNTGYYPESISFELNGKPAFLSFKFGDHLREFKLISQFLSELKKYARNERQTKMIELYVKSFQTGSIQAHWDSQIEWVLDVGPPVETNIGFIETYRDPSGVRGEWEGFVAMINKERTEKFQTLVENAPKFISLLPWDMSFEKDEFQAPDFTSLEVLTFAGSGIPAGINIPNYRLDVGFKNVSLGNVVSSRSSKEKVTFIDEHLQEDFKNYRVPAFEVQVGAHELLGHGTGKLLGEQLDGSLNFDKNAAPVGIDGKPVTTFYKKGETPGSVFGGLSGTMEECRAELVGLYLHLSRDFLEIFGYTTKEEQDKVIWVSWLNMARAGLVGLEQWDPKTEKWGQPHTQARYTILKTMLESGLVTLSYTKEDYSDLVLKLDDSKIETVGKKAIGDYLRTLHVYKCSADVENGTKFYNDKSKVGPEMAKFRDLVMSKRLPRQQFIQANTFIEDGKVVVKEYEESEIGMIQSFIERET